MKKPFAHSWTAEKLASLSRTDLEEIRKNAIRLNVGDLVALCDQRLVELGPVEQKRARRAQAERSETSVVTGYHFVCGNDLGVTMVGNGRFWSGSWVVAEDNVRESMKYGAYLALHESKAAISYRQGKILDYRRSSRGMVSKTEEGIEFLVEATNEPYNWVGAGAGEKGYQWNKIVDTSGLASSDKDLAK